jgi:phenylalanyl-tRNA synthetase beta chain
MKFSESWLRSFINPALASQELAHLLTMAGLEVEALEPVAPSFEHVVVGEVLSKEKHPDADRLNVLSVEVGQNAPLQIVCGAANVQVGMKAPCALVGAVLPGIVIKQAKVRGVESFGMMCSEKELGLADESDGLMQLPEDAKAGQDIRTYLDLDDHLLTLKLTPNRSDCLSLTGIAREVAALTNTEFSVSEVSPVVVSHQDRRNVIVENTIACPRYCGRIIRNVNFAALTPIWMQRRLERSGLRSVSAIVDITNYVLLELGQPLHAFDLARLSGDMCVRMARQGEKLVLLNQQEVTLQPDMLVIADDHAPLALAGIMGGEASAVADTTSDIFLESAFFVPAVIAGKARRLGVSTDSSYRFERGVDFSVTLVALERTSQLVLEICGGDAGPVTETIAALPERSPIRLRAKRVSDILGITLDVDQISALLRRLQLEFSVTDAVFTVVPPSYRFDLTIEEDLIEEVARIYGYDAIPALPPQAVVAMLPLPEGKRKADVLRQLLIAADYQEVVTYSFVDESWETTLQGNPNIIRLRNPIASNLSVMRSSLWGGLLDTLMYNLNRKQSRVRLFEIGATFLHQDTAFVETTKISGLCYGNAAPEQWGQPSRDVDFFDVKADIERLAGYSARFEAAQYPALHPGQSAQVIMEGRNIGWLGILHPRWQQHYELPRGVVMFELELAALQPAVLPVFSEVAKFPPIRRDIAVVVDEVVCVQDLLDVMYAENVGVVEEIALFDQYRGKGVESGKKSLAFLVLMQDTQRTLTDEEADAAVSQLMAAMARQCGAALRS